MDHRLSTSGHFSLDPRLNRWDLPGSWEKQPAKVALDQFQTYEVFLRKREDMPFAYTGPVHAPDLEIAFLFAKEQYCRRPSCIGLWVVKTQDVQVSPYVGDQESVYQVLDLAEVPVGGGPGQAFEIFHLKKRGKAHSHAGRVVAVSHQQALAQARTQFGDQQPCVNIWIIPANRMIQSVETDQDLWKTAIDKRYREPVAYKVLDKITAFKNQQLNP